MRPASLGVWRNCPETASPITDVTTRGAAAAPDPPYARRPGAGIAVRDEADDWYHKALTICEELGDRRGMALIYAQLGLLAEERGQAPLALDCNVRCVTLFDQFPSPMTRTGPSALARLTRQLGMPALQAAWQQITGQPVPQAVRDYLTSHHDDDQPGGTP